MDGFLANSVISNSRENGGKGWGDLVVRLPGDDDSLTKLSTKINEIFRIDYANPRESCLKRAKSAATLATEHEAGGDSR